MKPIRVCRAIALCTLISYMGWGIPTWAQSPIAHTKSDKCPVCGMFVYKYPDWVCQVHFRDQKVFYFDGAKDMFKFLQHPDQYAPDMNLEHISAIFVTEYYDLELISADRAWFVVDSDVYGPMGKELIPFANQQDAMAFLKDHKGKALLTFDQVTPQIIKSLD